MTRVVSHERSDVYHRPRRSWSVSACGQLLLHKEKVEAGVIDIEPRESAEEKGLRACERCFGDENE